MINSILGNMSEEHSLDHDPEDWGRLHTMLTEVLLVAFAVVFMTVFRAKKRELTITKKRMLKQLDFDDEPSPHDAELPIDREIKSAGDDKEQIIKVWRSNPEQVVQSSAVLQSVILAYFELERCCFVDEVVERLSVQKKLGLFATLLLDLTVETADLKFVEAVLASISGHVSLTHHMNEAVTAAFAQAGEEEKLAKWFEEVRNKGPQHRVTARGFSLAVRGLLHAERPEGALEYAKEMLKAGLIVSPFLVTDIFRTFCKVGRAAVALDLTLPEIVPNSHAAMLLFEHCLHAKDAKCAIRLEAILKDAKVEMHPKSYEVYLKNLVSQADPSAPRVLYEMHNLGISIPGGLCASLLCRAAEAKYVDFAETVIDFVRESKGGINITLYGALMNVYSCARDLEKACDLYNRVKADGLHPDQLMVNCLMKFALEINRQDLITELEQYVSKPLSCTPWAAMLRNVAQEKNVEKAFRLVAEKEATGEKLDRHSCNSILDVCIEVGAMKRAAELIAKMRADGSADIVTYNTLLKVFVKSANLTGAKEIFQEIEAAGLKPDVLSYNILINIAADTGNVKEAWELLDKMTSAKVQPDGYTVSIMFKAVKRMSSKKDGMRVLDLLDVAKVDVSKDEVLMNCALDACMRFGEKERASKLLSIQAKTKHQPDVHTYGILIRTAGFVDNVTRCRELWHEMVEVRKLVPTDVVLGSMTKALVHVGCPEEALASVRKWSSIVQPNQIVYGTLLRGFAEADRPDSLLEVVHEMRRSGVPVTTSMYGRCLDCLVRPGREQALEQLLKQIVKDGLLFDANIATTLTKYYCSVGALEQCFSLLKGVSGRHRTRTCDKRAQTLAFDKLLEGYVNAERFTEAAALVDAMGKYDVQPSKFTLASLVTMYGSTNQLHQAFEAMETMTKTYGIVPNNLVRKRLLDSCLANNDTSKAFDVFDAIRSTKDGADSKSFEAMIYGCGRLGWHRECARLVEEACGLSDVKPNFSPADLDIKVFEFLVSSLSTAGLMESIGVPLFNRLRTLGIVVPVPR